jgi:uncharacterized protein YyaL (SSP411 family)
MAVEAMNRFARLTGETRWSDLAEGVVTGLARSLERIPRAHPGMIGALQAMRSEAREVVVAGPGGGPELARVARRTPWPGLLVVEVDTARDDLDALAAAVPLVAGRRPETPSAYFCRDSVCDLPRSDPDDLRQALGEPSVR